MTVESGSKKKLTEKDVRDLSVFEVNRMLTAWYTADKLDDAANKIETNTGSPRNCAKFLAGHALAKAMMAWFDGGDLTSLKQWSYVAAKLHQKAYQMEIEPGSPGGKTLTLLTPMLSDNAELIAWFAGRDDFYDAKSVEDHKTHDFWAYQSIVALRGEWPRLAERCERVIADPPGKSAEQKYLIDHQFFLALARGDITGMVVALQEIAGPKQRRARSNDEQAFTRDLISTPAVIYAKIAWRHGYKLDIGSPYIPTEWLPNDPLEHYDNHYSFLT